MVTVIQDSTTDSDNLFNLNGKDYAKGKYTIVYDSIEISSLGVIDFSKARVGVINKKKFSEFLVRPKLVTNWNDGTAD